MPVQRTRVSLVCEQCAKPFERKPSEVARGVYRFCSNRCSADSRPSTALEDIWKYGERSDTGCLIWTRRARSSQGRGQIRINGKLQEAHRIAWVLANGPIPEGMHVLHRCDTPACFEPTHLWLGTHADNMRDMAEKGRQWLQDRGRRKRGADFIKPPGWTKTGESNPSAVINAAIVLDIRLRWESGVPMAHIAAIHGISQKSVSNVIKRKTWAHV
jgi:hypothetical protein